MKIYSKFDFWCSILLAVTAPLVWRLTDRFRWTTMLLWGFLVIRELYCSLSQEASEEARRVRERDLRIRQKHFGPLAKIVPAGGVILLAAAWILTVIVPDEGLNPPAWARWAVGILLVLSLVYMLWYAWIMRKYQELDEEEIQTGESGS